jgi:hypothetical protein
MAPLTQRAAGTLMGSVSSPDRDPRLPARGITHLSAAGASVVVANTAESANAERCQACGRAKKAITEKWMTAAAMTKAWKTSW